MPNCKVCNRVIIWRRTFGGNLIPLDPMPVAGGLFELRDGLALRVAANYTKPAYQPHRLECAKHARAQREYERRQLKLFES